MVDPIVCSGIEEVDDFAGVRVNAGKVGAFEEVAAVTCKCQSFQIVQVIIIRRVLFGDHMFDMKRNERSGVLRKMTIFATIVRSLPNQVFGRRIHVRNYDEPKSVEPSIGLWISHQPLRQSPCTQPPPRS